MIVSSAPRSMIARAQIRRPIVGGKSPREHKADTALCVHELQTSINKWLIQIDVTGPTAGIQTRLADKSHQRVAALAMAIRPRVPGAPSPTEDYR
jgi:hypothetical protein